MNYKLLEREREWLEQVKKDPKNEKLIGDYLLLMTKGSHSLANVLYQFSKMLEINDGEEFKADVDSFQQTLQTKLFKTFWKYENPVLEELMSDVIYKAIFTDSVSAKLWKAYKKKYSTQDDRFIAICHQNDDVKLSNFGVKPRFCLDGEDNPYSGVIHLIKTIEDDASIENRLNIIGKGISDISRTVKHYYLFTKEYTDEQLSLAADDMLPIFVYILLRAKITCMYTVLNLCSDFMDEEAMRGSGGYCLATLETAMNEISGLKYEDVPPRRPSYPKPFVKKESDDDIFVNSPPLREPPRIINGKKSDPPPVSTEKVDLSTPPKWFTPVDDDDLFSGVAATSLDEGELEQWFNK